MIEYIENKYISCPAITANMFNKSVTDFIIQHLNDKTHLADVANRCFINGSFVLLVMRLGHK